LKQGALYIIKIHHVSVGLFQGKRLTTTNYYRKGLTLTLFILKVGTTICAVLLCFVSP
jgi:hypothetical protein